MSAHPLPASAPRAEPVVAVEAVDDPDPASPRRDRDSVRGPVVAVLTAAGSGTRLGAEGPKALVELGGETLVHRAARGLLAGGGVERIVITAPARDLSLFRTEVSDLGPAVDVVAGAPSSRQASVALGLASVLDAMPGAAVVLVHDAARPLTPPGVMRRVIDAVLAGHPAVVPALRVTDTIKAVGGALPGDGPLEPVIGTPDRSTLRAVQTPQGFEAGTLLAAHRAGASRADDESLAAPDDASLVEACGGSVVVVPGDPLALKVTTRVDLAVAEMLLANGGDGANAGEGAGVADAAGVDEPTAFRGPSR